MVRRPVGQSVAVSETAPCPGCPVPGVPSRVSHPGWSILGVHSKVPSWVSCPRCPFQGPTLGVPPWVSHARCPFQDPVLGVLSLGSRPGCHILGGLSWVSIPRSHPSCPVPSVHSKVPSWVSCPRCLCSTLSVMTAWEAGRGRTPVVPHHHHHHREGAATTQSWNQWHHCLEKILLSSILCLTSPFHKIYHRKAYKIYSSILEILEVCIYVKYIYLSTTLWELLTSGTHHLPGRHRASCIGEVCWEATGNLDMPQYFPHPNAWYEKHALPRSATQVNGYRKY